MLKKSDFVKIRVAVPASDAEKVRSAMATAEAGEQGKYSDCSSSIMSVGRFRPLAGSHPAIGQIGQLEEVDEEIIEMLCHIDKVEAVILALRQAHPYEEPAIDIMPRFEVE